MLGAEVEERVELASIPSSGGAEELKAGGEATALCDNIEALLYLMHNL